jgi:deaminated glutathione amidase
MIRKIFPSLFLLGILYHWIIPADAVAQSQKMNPQDGKIRIASCQFPVSSDIEANYNWIEEQMVEASLKKATIVHFPECALSGYPGADMESLENFEWKKLHRFTDSVLVLAKKLNLWVVLGSIHRLSGQNKPYNSLYAINSAGEVVDRYDKRFCTSGDLEHFSSGNHFVTFKVNGVNCGLLICHDVRYPELYREYRKLGADVIFHSFYNARAGKGSILPEIMHVTAQGSAASNYFYMSLTNCSVPESWPCYFITPDGLVQNKLTKNVPSILISDVDLSAKYYDSTKEFRPDAMSGKLFSGGRITDSAAGKRNRVY